MAYSNFLFTLCLSSILIAVPVLGGTDTSGTDADKTPLLNLRQFSLPPSGVGYHAHDCPEETQWTLCNVYETQADKSLKPYSGRLNWDAYDANGREVFRSCCAHEGYIKIDRRFMKPGDVYFIVAEMDGEVLFGMPQADAEPNVAHFSAIPIWTYSDFIQWFPLHDTFCWDCNKLQASDFSEQSVAKGGPQLHSSLTICVPAKSSVTVTKSPLGIADVPIYYITVNEKLSTYYKTMKRTDENGTVDFRIHRETDTLGFFALHGGCLHPSKKKPDSESEFEVELPDNMVTLVLKKDGDVLYKRRVVITDVELNSTISAVDLISDESGHVEFIPPSNTQYRILVFWGMFHEYAVSQPFQPSMKAETIVFDLTASKNEEGDKESPATVSLLKEGNTDQASPRVVIPEPRRFWKDFQLTSAFGRVEDKSNIREFNVYRVLEKSRTPIDNKPALVEILFLERVLYSLFYTELSENMNMVREKLNVQQPILAPSVPSL